MLSPAKGSRRSTRAGRHRGSGGGSRPSSRGGGEVSWRPSDKSARKWMQVMRPPGPGARFEVSTWVPVDELTLEEKVKLGLLPKEAPPADKDMTPENAMDQTTQQRVELTGAGGSETAADKEMTAEVAMDQTTQQQKVESVVADSTVGETSGYADTEMTVVDSNVELTATEKPMESDVPVAAVPNAEVPPLASTSKDTKISNVEPPADNGPNAEVPPPVSTSEETEIKTVAPPVNNAEANPLDMLVSTEANTTDESASAPAPDCEKVAAEANEEAKPSQLESKGISEASRPTVLSPLNTSESEGIPAASDVAAKAHDTLEEPRPHDPIADTLEDTTVVPPSRPVSEPAAILLKGPAVPLLGDSVVSPVPAVAVPAKEPSPPTGPVTATPAETGGSFIHSGSDTAPFHTPAKEELATEAEPPSTVDSTSEPATKKPRLE